MNYLASIAETFNPADWVTLGLLGLVAIYFAAWYAASLAAFLWERSLTSLARWHARQVIKANTPEPFPPNVSPLPWAPLVVTAAIVGLLVLVVATCGGVG